MSVLRVGLELLWLCGIPVRCPMLLLLLLALLELLLTLLLLLLHKLLRIHRIILIWLCRQHLVKVAVQLGWVLRLRLLLGWLQGELLGVLQLCVLLLRLLQLCEALGVVGCAQGQLL